MWGGSVTAKELANGKMVQKGRGEPLYVQLASLIREKIYSKAWSIGSRVPSEHELMRIFNLSRGTVRRALQILVDEGMLVQHHGKGTFVAEPGIAHAGGVRPLSFDQSLRMQGKKFITRVIEKRVTSAPLDVANELKIELGGAVMYLRRVRDIEGEPAICQESWTNLAECPGIESEDFTQTSLFDAVQLHSGRKVKFSVMHYQALVAGKEHGELLGCDESAAVLMLEQNIHLDDDTPIEWSSTWLKPGQSIVETAYQS